MDIGITHVQINYQNISETKFPQKDLGFLNIAKTPFPKIKIFIPKLG